MGTVAIVGPDGGEVDRDPDQPKVCVSCGHERDCATIVLDKGDGRVDTIDAVCGSCICAALSVKLAASAVEFNERASQ